jgi:hypothetical protein
LFNSEFIYFVLRVNNDSNSIFSNDCFAKRASLIGLKVPGRGSDFRRAFLCCFNPCPRTTSGNVNINLRMLFKRWSWEKTLKSAEKRVC